MSHKLSPNFEARFARIELDLLQERISSLKLPSKYLTSQNKPPIKSQSPVLSTAKRAHNRSLKQSTSLQSYHTYQNSYPVPVSLDKKLKSKPVKQIPIPTPTSKPTLTSHKRVLSSPLPPAPQFSFMRETSSSSLKKHAGVKPIKKLASTSNLHSPVSVVELPSLQDLAVRRKRITRAELHSRTPSNSWSKSKCTPSDITNIKDKPRQKHPYSALSMVKSQCTKIMSLTSLCNVIYEENSSLFGPGSGDHHNYTTNASFSPQSVINDSEEGSLNIYERGEILRKKDLYYIPSKVSARSINIRNYSENYGFDDENGNYVVLPHDHINYRYEINQVLGNGSFGNVVLCKDHKYSHQGTNKVVAIKIIKNDTNWSLQAVYEIKMLKHLNENFKVGGNGIKNFDSEYLREYANDSNECPVLTYYDYFNFRGHMCIITEVLSLNLYSLLELTKFKGLSTDLLRFFSKKILLGLEFIHGNNIIHCDIKPENIMVKLPSDFHPDQDVDEHQFNIKIIDFGSSCLNNEISYSYIQSRFYRAPEVIVGAKYDNMIDIWSFGCVIAELYSGSPLFPGRSEIEQIGLIAEVLGAPASSLILGQRTRLVKSIRSQNATKKLVETDLVPVRAGIADEKSIKRTLLYSLFDLEGKFNLQFLNMRLQATPPAPGSGPAKKNIRLSSKSLDLLLKVASNTTIENKQDTKWFIKFLYSVFKWDPDQRLSASDLLNHRFLSI